MGGLKFEWFVGIRWCGGILSDGFGEVWRCSWIWVRSPAFDVDLEVGGGFGFG